MRSTVSAPPRRAAHCTATPRLGRGISDGASPVGGSRRTSLSSCESRPSSDMPVQYKTGILDEHKTVREAVGIFDVSHMGEVSVKGPRAAEAVQRMVTNDVSRLGDGHAMYTCSCREHGGIVDDLIVYRCAADDFFLIVNASTSSKDFAHFVEHAGHIAEWTNLSDDYGLLSVQGPSAPKMIASLTGGNLVPP